MKKMYLTKEGQLTETVKEVYIAEDGTICKCHNEGSAYEKLGFKPVYPEKITFNDETWEYPELDGYSLEVVYTRVEDSDYKVCFGIDKDGLYLKEVFCWNRCSELDEYTNIDRYVGTRIEDLSKITGIYLQEY